MLRILQMPGGMNKGGIETLLINIHKQIDRSRLQFDYMVSSEEKQDYEDEILALGGIVHRSPSFTLRKLNYFQYTGFMREFLSQHKEYKIVHAHQFYAMWLALKEAKKQGRITIAHTHSTSQSTDAMRKFLFKTFSYPERFIADYFFACSKEAGIRRFGKKVDAKFLPNAFETSIYKFSPETRKMIRKSRGITSEKTLVIGHVGRFEPVKNHKFLIDAFSTLHEKIPDSKLWLVGRGSLEDDIRAQVHGLGLDDAVDFIGLTGKVNEYLAGMDVFAFPSFFEGFGNAVIEAQCSGLPCIASDRVPDEAIITDRASRLEIAPASRCATLWADALIDSANHKGDRENYAQIVREAGFDVEPVARMLEDFYFSIAGN